MLIFLLILLIRAQFSNSSTLSKYDDSWSNFKETYNRAYVKHEEELLRRQIWEENMAKIERHNLDADMGKYGFKLGITSFTDKTLEEMKVLNGLLTKTSLPSSENSMFNSPSEKKLPSSIDWRKEGLVTEVKDQGQCGSCWAFSATGALEGQYKRKHNKLVDLSEQNLVDCSTNENMGCDGGSMTGAYEYIKKNYGIDTEQSYPYTAKDGRCRYNRRNKGATLSSWASIPTRREDILKEAVANVGPISAGMNAGNFAFQHYKSGIFDSKFCDPENLDHAVLIVGYGNENGKEYWIAKNSWGKGWGENGYFRLPIHENACGIADLASFPVI